MAIDKFDNKFFDFEFDCACGCGILKVTIDKHDEDTLYFGYYTSSFYAKQRPGWNDFKDRLKMIWCAIRGKEFILYDLVLQGKDLDRFKEFCNEVVTNCNHLKEEVLALNHY